MGRHTSFVIRELRPSAGERPPTSGILRRSTPQNDRENAVILSEATCPLVGIVARRRPNGHHQLRSSSAKPLPPPAAGSGRDFAPSGAREDPVRGAADSLGRARIPSVERHSAGTRPPTSGILQRFALQNDSYAVILSEAKDPVRRMASYRNTSSYNRDSSALRASE